MPFERPYEILTPESVVFTCPEAGVYSRFLAWSLDALLMCSLLLGGNIALGLLTSLTFGLAQPLTYVWVFLVTTGYFIACEWRMGGSSPGKRLLRLRVIRNDGLKLTFSQSVVRNLLRVVDSLPLLYGVALIVAALSRHSRRLGDHVAQTLVIAEPVAVAPQAVRAESTRLALDPAFRDLVRRHTTVEERDLALSAALRRDELRASARVDIFRRLGRHFVRRLDLEKPEHLSDERFVCEIAAALVG